MLNSDLPTLEEKTSDYPDTIKLKHGEKFTGIIKDAEKIIT